MNVNLLKRSKKWLLAIAGVMLAFAVQAQGREVCIQSFIDDNAGKHAGYLSLTDEGALVWTEVVDENSVWLEIPVDGSTTDFYFQHVATGDYLYRGNERGKTFPTGDWDWETAGLDELDAASDFFKFRPIDSRWGGRVWLMNIAGVTAAKPEEVSGSAFFLSGINNLHGGDGYLPFPQVIMGAQPGEPGGTGNVWTSVKIVDAGTVEQTWAVRFNTTGGSPVDAKRVADGASVAAPENDPAKTDYTFIGWYSEETCENEFDFDSAITESIVIYAGWEYTPEPIEALPDRKVRIRGFRGDDGGIQEKYRPVGDNYYVSENEDGDVVWTEELGENSIWWEIQVEGTRDFYYKNAVSGKYLYRSQRDVKIGEDEDEEPIMGKQTLPMDGEWYWELALLSEEKPDIDDEEDAFYRFSVIPQNNGADYNYKDGDQAWLVNMGGVVTENPIEVNNAAFVLGPMNLNHGVRNAPEYPAVIMHTQNARGGNAWSRVHITPAKEPVRIIAYNNDPPNAGPDQFLAVTVTRETVENDEGEEIEIDVYTVEWTETANANSGWYEIEVIGSTTEFYYQNIGTGKFLYRDDARELDGDWDWNLALVSDTYEATDFYHFRKVKSGWWGDQGKDQLGRIWLVNMAGAGFGDDGKQLFKESYALSGINANHNTGESPKMPAAVMTVMPDGGNVWTSVIFGEYTEQMYYTVTVNLNGGGSTAYIRIDEGDLFECPEEPSRSGYTFAGWFTDAAFENSYDCAAPRAVTENFTVFAKWDIEDAPTDCTPDIRIVQIRAFQGGNNIDGKFWPGAYLRATDGGSLIWTVYKEMECEWDGKPNYCSGSRDEYLADDGDKNAQWYEIPVVGSNFDFYYKNVKTGHYLYLEPNSGPEIKDEEGNVTGYKDIVDGKGEGHWIWKEVKLSKTVDRTADNFKWRPLEPLNDWPGQGWNAYYVYSLYHADFSWTQEASAYGIGGMNRNHGGDGFPAWDGGVVMASTTPENVYNGNVWGNVSYLVFDESVSNPDCCAEGEEFIECCNGEPCEEQCIPDPNDPCVCEPGSNECVFIDCSKYPDAAKCQTGVPEIGYLQDLKAFPNPTNNLLLISELKGGELITVYNMNGQRVLDSVATSGQAGISVSQLPKGAYIVKVSTGRGEWSTKFVVN